MEPFSGITQEEYFRDRHRRFGEFNGQLMDVPLWKEAVRSEYGAYGISTCFGNENGFEWGKPRWSFNRFGRSCTLIESYQEPTRHVWIAGEHEDFYDPDFCIYNDVILTSKDGSVDIYGYPRDEFEPTDFHSATLIGGRHDWASIYIIGRLGYPETRVLGTTPIYRLDLEDMTIREVSVRGRSQAGSMSTMLCVSQV